MSVSLDPAILALRREYVCAALDGLIGQAHACGRFFLLDADEPALKAFDRVKKLLAEAETEIAMIRAAQVDDLTRETAAEWRADRDAVQRTKARSAA